MLQNVQKKKVKGGFAAGASTGAWMSTVIFCSRHYAAGDSESREHSERENQQGVSRERGYAGPRHSLLSFVLVWGNSTVCLLKGKHRNDVAVGGVQPQIWVDVSPSPSLKSDGNTSDRLQTRGCVTAGVWLDLSNNNPVRFRIRSLFENFKSILYAI